MSNKIKLPKAILFDWDDTLAHTRTAVVEAMEYILKKYGREDWDTTKNKYRDTSKSLKENFPNFFGEEANQAYTDYLEYYIQNAYNKVVPLEGAKDFLQSCLHKNIKLYIISNKEKSLLLREVAFCFPKIPFTSILGNGDAKHNKPYPDLVYAALANTDYEINKENIWLIGDTKQDTECAYNAGIQPILLGKGKFMDETYIKDKIHAQPSLWRFDNFKDIEKILHKR